MNVSFGAFRIVNSYGAFGSITKVRHEVGTVLVVVVVVIVVLVLVVILVVIEFLYYIQFGTIDIIILLYTLIYIYYCRLFYRVQMKAVYTRVLCGKTSNLLANLEISTGETQYIYLYIYVRV